VKLAHKIALDPTPQQRRFFTKAVDAARFIYNWGLEEWTRQEGAGERPNGFTLKKQFNAIKREQFPWVTEVHKDACARPFKDLQAAFTNFFARRADRPVFKKKKSGQGSFYVANDRFTVAQKTVRLPKVGRVKMREVLRFEGKIIGARIRQEAGRWFIAIQVDVPDAQRPRTGEGIVGVDLGITTLATLSTGEKVVGPKALYKNSSKLRRLDRSLSHKHYGSKNWEKARHRLARCHRRIANLRREATHQLTTGLCHENQVVVIEDLGVSNIRQNRHLTRAVVDANWGELRRQLEYKQGLFGTRLVIAPRIFPSSKQCSVCWYVLAELPISKRRWTCPRCGTVHDREINAAVNLEQLGWVAADFKPVERPALALSSCEKGEPGLGEAGTVPLCGIDSSRLASPYLGTDNSRL